MKPEYDASYPCDIVPTENLRIRKRRALAPEKNKRGQQQQAQLRHTYVPLPESSGLSILKYVYDAFSIMDAIPLHYNAPDLPGDSFFGISHSNGVEGVMSMIEKARFLATLYPRVENIPRITRSFLQRHGITVGCLLTKCRVPIIDLWSAGICTTLDDLCDLGFQITDLTNQTGDTRLFNVNHMMQLFKAGASEMAAHPVIALDVRHLVVARFSPADLQALDVSLPDMIEKQQIALRHLRDMGYATRDLYALGVRLSHLRALGIGSPELATRLVGWPAKEFSVFK